MSALWTELSQQIYLVNERFVKKMQNKLSKDAELGEHPHAQCRAKPKPLHYYKSRYVDKKHGMAEAYITGDCTMKEIAGYFGVHYSILSRAIKGSENY